MDNKERVALIRKGNELFNEGKINEASKIFVKTKYRDGLTRVADYLFYDKKLPLYAFKYYKMAGSQERINEIFERMVFALNKMLKQDDDSDNGDKPSVEKSNGEPDKNQTENSKSTADEEPSSGLKLPPLKVSPKLKILAEEILRDNEKNAREA